jgi:hypothetical protein
MPKGMGHTAHPLPRAQNIIDAGIQRFRELHPDMAARTVIPIELITCIETAVYRVLAQLWDEINAEKTTIV